MAKPTKYRKVLPPIEIEETKPERWKVISSGEVYEKRGENFVCVESKTKTGSTLTQLNLGICHKLQ